MAKPASFKTQDSKNQKEWVIRTQPSPEEKLVLKTQAPNGAEPKPQSINTGSLANPNVESKPKTK